jgi:hypothetical protein
MTTDPKLCTVYDQISDRTCRYYANHGGTHNFARLDHDTRLERELRRELDEMTKALADALDLFDANWCPEHSHTPNPATFQWPAELRKLVPGSKDANYP